eukprot:COSAG01_NODE_1620_length_9713_cov_4.117433_2_plen_110_part_00
MLLDLLVYAGLAKFAHVLSAAAAKAQLADMAKRLFLQQLDLFGQVNENTNGVLGVGSDSTWADSYYHWGALHALGVIYKHAVVFKYDSRGTCILEFYHASVLAACLVVR